MKLIRGKYLFADITDEKNGILTDGAVLVEGEKIAEVGSYSDLKQRFSQAEELGGEKDLVMPGIIDAHTHGRGLSYIQKGIPFDYLENCIFSWMGAVDLPADLNAQLMAVRHIRNGSTMMNMIDNLPLFDENVVDRAKTTVENYGKTGIRCAYAPGIKDVNALANDDEAFYETLPPHLQKTVHDMVFFDKTAAQDYFVEAFREMRNSLHSDMTNIILGPTWAHGCTDAFYEKLRRLSEEYGGLPMHIHTLQTPYQREYGERKYGKSLLAHMKDCGIVDEHLVLGHAVYLTESDMELLGEAHASVTHHPSCNLLMRNGIAPVWYMLQHGVNVALGIDEKQLADDEDVLEELRMIYALHRVPDYDMAHTPALTPFQVLAMGTTNAARTVGLDGKLGKLQKGQLADLIVVDTHHMTEDPWTAPDADIRSLFIHRAQGRFVKDVIINGEIVMRDRKLTKIDVDGLCEEVRAYMEQAWRKEPTQYQLDMRDVRGYYHKWVEGKVQISNDVFYQVNAR